MNCSEPSSGLVSDNSREKTAQTTVKTAAAVFIVVAVVSAGESCNSMGNALAAVVVVVRSSAEFNGDSKLMLLT